ncbi:hypothetical protein AOLI_G00250210 [Acnodon oligacanthus]
MPYERRRRGGGGERQRQRMRERDAASELLQGTCAVEQAAEGLSTGERRVLKCLAPCPPPNALSHRLPLLLCGRGEGGRNGGRWKQRYGRVPQNTCGSQTPGCGHEKEKKKEQKGTEGARIAV